MELGFGIRQGHRQFEGGGHQPSKNAMHHGLVSSKKILICTRLGRLQLYWDKPQNHSGKFTLHKGDIPCAVLMSSTYFLLTLEIFPAHFTDFAIWPQKETQTYHIKGITSLRRIFILFMRLL